ncbi:uncharacterized protein LOC141673979 [Apium graveolens]|uniref:uncharacterized protein LOC141673979 n=1 Tax=Apium graveolens TaxID=4045 RepID=UPI003D7BD56D
MIKELMKEVDANILCLQETKCVSWNKFWEKLIWANDQHSWLIQNSEGLSGGLLIAWDELSFKSIWMASCKNWQWIHFKVIASEESFHVLNVYGPLSLQYKKKLWEDFSFIFSIILCIAINEKVCIVGDFNSIRDDRESANCTYRMWDVQGFDYFIKNNNLCDITLVNGEFTWFGPHGKCSKLDRFLLNDNWFSTGYWEGLALHKMVSDHKPILLAINLFKGGPVPFKAFNWWLKEEGIRNDMNDFWKQVKVFDSKENFQVLLKKFKLGLKQWSKGSKDSLDLHIEELKSKLELFDKNHIWNDEILKCSWDLALCFKKRDSILKQKARLLWNLQGDKTLSFFIRLYRK